MNMTENIELEQNSNLYPLEEDPTILNSEKYESLLKMLQSADSADHLMAQFLLNNCNVNKSIYWIWKLGKNYSSRMVNLRTKASRKFRDDSRLFHIINKNSYHFVSYLKSQELLTTEIFMLLKDDLLRYAEKICNNLYFDFSLTLKEEYKQFDVSEEW